MVLSLIPVKLAGGLGIFTVSLREACWDEQELQPNPASVASANKLSGERTRPDITPPRWRASL